MSWLVIRTLLGGWLKRLFGLFTAYPLQCALVASLACNVWLWRGWNHERAGRRADAALYIAAGDEAQRRQDKADHDNMTGQIAHLDQLEKNHAPLEAARRDAVADYVARHRMPARACSAISGPGSSGLSDYTRPAAGAPGLSDTVAVPVLHLDQFGQVEMHDSEAVTFLRGLVDQGLAVPASQVK